MDTNIKEKTNSNIFSKIVYCATIFLMFCYVFYQLRYSVIANDDMQDFICLDLNFYHGRFFTTIFQYLIIKKIPDLFNINYQEFALFSQSTIKTLLIIWGINATSLSIVFFQKKRNYLYLSIINIFILILFLSLINNLKFIFGIEVSEFFYGYIFPIPLFIIFFHKTFKYLILNNKFTKLELTLYTIILTILVSTNEEYSVSIFLILAILLINKLLSQKSKQKIRELVFFLIIILVEIYFMYKSNGFEYVVDDYSLNLVSDIKLDAIKNFLISFFDRIIKNISFLWVLLFLTIVLNVINKSKKFSTKNIINYIIITNLSFIIFFILLFFLGETFTYENYYYYNVLPRYWVLQPGLLICFYTTVLSSILFLISYYERKTKKKNYIILIFLTILISTCFIMYNFENKNLSMENRKKILYIADKISVYYFSKGQTALLPAQDMDLILPTYQNSMPKDLEDKTGKSYKDKVYKDILYLKYLEKTYNVNTEYGCKFTEYDTAINEYIKLGGTLEKEELKELNFKKIKNFLNQQ